ncbi:MAG: GAF domain-containing protein [Bacteroidota bacterium]
MSEDLLISGESKTEKYTSLLPQLKALIGNEKDLIANLANISAALKSTFGFFWVGFYWVKNDELVLAPFQGTVACTRIALGRGVCGSAWKEAKTILVKNVDEFPGHIACSSLSKSEIVVPIIQNNIVLGVLDVDSDELNDFDETDKKYLEEICQWIATFA